VIECCAHSARRSGIRRHVNRGQAMSIEVAIDRALATAGGIDEA
jgi:hypothetical protein